MSKQQTHLMFVKYQDSKPKFIKLSFNWRNCKKWLYTQVLNNKDKKDIIIRNEILKPIYTLSYYNKTKNIEYYMKAYDKIELWMKEFL